MQQYCTEITISISKKNLPPAIHAQYTFPVCLHLKIFSASEIPSVFAPTDDAFDMLPKGNRTAELTTVSGGKLWVMMKGKHIVLKDAKGGMAEVTISDVYRSDGVIHIIDHVIMPN